MVNITREAFRGNSVARTQVHYRIAVNRTQERRIAREQQQQKKSSEKKKNDPNKTIVSLVKYII